MLKPSANTVQGLKELHLTDLLEQQKKRIKATGPTGEHAGAGTRPLTSVADAHLGIQVGPITSGMGQEELCSLCSLALDLLPPI